VEAVVRRMEYRAEGSQDILWRDGSLRWDGGRRGVKDRRIWVGLAILIGASTCFALGIFAAGSKNLSVNDRDSDEENLKEENVDAAYDYSWAMEAVNWTQIREYLVVLSKEPHMAGLERDEFLARWIAAEWEAAGLDSVRVEGYEILLDYPDPTNPNYVRVLDAEGSIIYQSHYKEEGVDDPNFVDAFNAYSKNGTAEGVPVYANYGDIQDFEFLRDTYGPELTKGAVCLARYGKIFRGNKAENAANAGCSGLVIFMDPSAVAMEGLEEEDLYPNTFWMPGTAVQRGSLALADGDPLTPNWPSVEHAYRLDAKDREAYLPRIPVQPVGYTDAGEILSRMGGDRAPQDWQGGIPNVTYRIGGQFKEGLEGATVTVEVNNKQEQKFSNNVIGVLLGSEEPDRYVMMGNHRDAWGFGAVDPSSGTAQMMEVARVLGSKAQTGWRPRRTIVLLSWGAEEYSLCGSREFVEQYEIQLSERGVGYINTDVCMAGPILEPSASPTLRDLIKEAVKDVTSPENEEESYYDFWRRWAEEGEDFTPEVSPFVGAGSDHASFLFYAGIPVMDLMFVTDSKVYPNLTGIYPAYHTGYETFRLVDEIYDPEYKIFRACAQLNLRLSLELAESKMLPFTMENYAEVMEAGMEELEATGLLDKVEALGIDTRPWNSSVYQFRKAAQEFDTFANLVAETRPEMVKLVNDQMRGFERNFLLAEGLPDRVQYRHVVTAPSLFDAYGGSAFPGIGDLLYSIQKESGDADRNEELTKKLRKHVSDLMILVQRASRHLNIMAAL